MSKESSKGEDLSAGAADTVSIGGELEVNRLGFGAMRLSGPGIWGDPPDRAAARRVLERALELGVDFIDTADAYGPESNERLIADTLHPYPAGLVIATKGGLKRPGPGEWVRDGRPQHLRSACDGSLRRLRLDCIDLYQLHAPDPQVAIEDSLGELARLKEQGKIRHIGVSNFDLAQLERAERIVDLASVQNRYNLADRSSEEVLRWCERKDLVFIPWFPLGAGEHVSTKEQHGPLARLRRIATRRGITLAQAALAWQLARSPALLPIPGTSSIVHLEENVAAAAIRLSDEELAEIEGQEGRRD